MSRFITKPAFCLSENKDADQLFSHCTADQHLCLCYTDKYNASFQIMNFKLLASSDVLWLYRLVFAGVGRKPCWPKTGLLVARLIVIQVFSWAQKLRSYHMISIVAKDLSFVTQTFGQIMQPSQSKVLTEIWLFIKSDLIRVFIIRLAGLLWVHLLEAFFYTFSHFDLNLSCKGGLPLLKSVPSQKVSRGEAHRLIDIAQGLMFF